MYLLNRHKLTKLTNHMSHQTKKALTLNYLKKQTISKSNQYINRTTSNRKVSNQIETDYKTKSKKILPNKKLSSKI